MLLWRSLLFESSCQTVFSLKRSWTVCCPLFVGGWHYFFSTAEWQCFLKKELQNGRTANTCLSTNCFVCLRGKVFIWKAITPVHESSETTHIHKCSWLPTAAHEWAWAQAAHGPSVRLIEHFLSVHLHLEPGILRPAVSDPPPATCLAVVPIKLSMFYFLLFTSPLCVTGKQNCTVWENYSST